MKRILDLRFNGPQFLVDLNLMLVLNFGVENQFGNLEQKSGPEIAHSAFSGETLS